jgi:hypothetical protein
MILTTILGYAPAPTDSLTILFGGPVTGFFMNGGLLYAGSFNGVNYSARITYTATSVILSDFRPVPEPAAWLLAGGAAAAWAWRRRGPGR